MQIRGVPIKLADPLSAEDAARLEWIVEHAAVMAAEYAEKNGAHWYVRKLGGIYWFRQPDQMWAAWGLPQYKANGEELIGWYTGDPKCIVNVGWAGDWKILWHELGHHYFGGEEAEDTVQAWADWAMDYERRRSK